MSVDPTVLCHKKGQILGIRPVNFSGRLNAFPMNQYPPVEFGFRMIDSCELYGSVWGLGRSSGDELEQPFWAYYGA